MSAMVGQMFYTGEMPWHRFGVRLPNPATVEDALKFGELEWEVGDAKPTTGDDPTRAAARAGSSDPLARALAGVGPSLFGTAPNAVSDRLARVRAGSGPQPWWAGVGVPLYPRTAEEARSDPPLSPGGPRKAIVRLDRPDGHKERVLGVVHQDFQPVQNRDGAMLFDAIFGRGRAVYHTGGYLGIGQVVWLLARIDRQFEVAPGDIVQPYALLANSHDGSIAFHIGLTTIRVVCANTLILSLHEQSARNALHRTHRGTLFEHAEAARDHFGAVMGELDEVAETLTALARNQCDDARFQEIVEALLPDPAEPPDVDSDPDLLMAWEGRLAAVRAARAQILELRETGKGMDLPGSRGTYWSALNAVTEYVDHHREVEGARVADALLGAGKDLKARAYHLIRDDAAGAVEGRLHGQVAVPL